MLTQDFVEQLNQRTFISCYDDPDRYFYQPPMHKKVRGKYLPAVRCEYCWMIPEKHWGKCEACGAPL